MGTAYEIKVAQSPMPAGDLSLCQQSLEGDMLRCISVVLTATLFVGGVFAQEKAPATVATAEEKQMSTRAGLRGVWKVTEQSSRVPGEGWTAITPNVSLYVFTEKHYSYMFTIGAGPRRLFAGGPNKPTDAEKVGHTIRSSPPRAATCCQGQLSPSTQSFTRTRMRCPGNL